jgi:DNA-binding winged helix-turn-helix (wHTH) protein
MTAYIDAEKLADCLWALLKDPEKLQAKKKAARNCWKQRVNSDSNYAFFAERLASLVS